MLSTDVNQKALREKTKDAGVRRTVTKRWNANRLFSLLNS
jgi:hypothetical protein